MGLTKKRNLSSSSNGTGSTRKSNVCITDKVISVSASNNCPEKSSPDDDQFANEHNQPDLVKGASAAAKGAKTYARTGLAAGAKDVDNLQRENKELACELRRHALGFNAMATLVDHLANNLGAMDVTEFNGQLKQKLSNLQTTIDKKNQEIGNHCCPFPLIY